MKNGSAGKYIPVVPTSLFTEDIVANIVSSKEKVAGLILHPNNETLASYSHESKCPNDLYNIKGTCPSNGWNPSGKNLIK